MCVARIDSNWWASVWNSLGKILWIKIFGHWNVPSFFMGARYLFIFSNATYYLLAVFFFRFASKWIHQLIIWWHLFEHLNNNQCSHFGSVGYRKMWMGACQRHTAGLYPFRFFHSNYSFECSIFNRSSCVSLFSLNFAI